MKVALEVSLWRYDYGGRCGGTIVEVAVEVQVATVAPPSSARFVVLDKDYHLNFRSTEIDSRNGL